MDSSCIRIMRLLPVFILDDLNRCRKNGWPSSSQKDYASFKVRSVFTLDE